MEWMLDWDIAHNPKGRIRQTGSSRPLRKIKSRRESNAASLVCARNGAKTLNPGAPSWQATRAICMPTLTLGFDFPLVVSAPIVNKPQRSCPVVTNNNVVACIKTEARGAMRGRRPTLLSIFSCRGFRAREDLTNRVPAVPHTSAPKEPTSQTCQLARGTPPSWRDACSPGRRERAQRRPVSVHCSCLAGSTRRTRRTRRTPPRISLSLFALVCDGVTRHARRRRTELSPPCPALRFSMARADIMGCGWVAGGPGPRFVSFRKPSQHRPPGASDNPRFQDGPHRSPFHHAEHTSQPDGLGRLGIGGRVDLEIKKSLHNPSIGRVRRIRCAAPRQPWATSGRLLGNFWATSGRDFWATLGAGLGGRRMSSPIPFRPLPGCPSRGSKPMALPTR